MARFSLKDKRKHYTDVANGTTPTKADSKFSEAEQRAYARGQRDARNENARIFASKNATPEQKESWRLKKARERVAYLEQKEKNKQKKK
ncbi:MAG: hypothetical protein K2O39_06615 [Clostridiales bacterium]|nr:hypothetical protein [Clostridiales bacterium]